MTSLITHLNAARSIAIALVCLGATAHADPPVPLPDGSYPFRWRDAEFPRSMGFPVTVEMRGTEVRVVNNRSSAAAPLGEVERGRLMWHPGSNQWILGAEAKDRLAATVGGCGDDDPLVIDFEARDLWTCQWGPAGPDEEEAAGPEALAQLDGYALGLAQAGRYSGVLLVAKDGRVVLERAYGKRDEQGEAANTIDTSFSIASAGKMFTAVAILQQVAAGRLTLDTKVGEVLRDYPNKDFASQVTIRHLLTHTAGAGDIDLFGVEHAREREQAQDVAAMLALHAQRAPAFPPGSKQEYGNFGHVVLGRIVEVLSGQSFEAYVRDHIFRPVGMSHTGFADCAERAPDVAVGYVEINGERVSNCATQPRKGFPAGGQVSTARDLLAFTQALQAGDLIPAPLFAEAIRPQRDFMGLGFFATEYGPGFPRRNFRWGHGGSSDGICADVRTYPSTGETIITLSNKDPPGCFEVAGFLHQQWEIRRKQSRSADAAAVKPVHPSPESR